MEGDLKISLKERYKKAINILEFIPIIDRLDIPDKYNLLENLVLLLDSHADTFFYSNLWFLVENHYRYHKVLAAYSKKYINDSMLSVRVSNGYIQIDESLMQYLEDNNIYMFGNYNDSIGLYPNRLGKFNSYLNTSTCFLFDLNPHEDVSNDFDYTRKSRKILINALIYWINIIMENSDFNNLNEILLNKYMSSNVYEKKQFMILLYFMISLHHHIVDFTHNYDCIE
jgi:hypothetical protein